MILLDYLYYQFTNFYKYFQNDGTHKGSGLILTCAFIWFDVIFALMLNDFIFDMDLFPKNKYVTLVYLFPIVLFVCLRYWKFTSYEEIKEEVSSYSNTKKIWLDIYLIIYVIVSFPCFIAFGVYVGLNK